LKALLSFDECKNLFNFVKVGIIGGKRKYQSALKNKTLIKGCILFFFWNSTPINNKRKIALSKMP
jgi:hypothetical protein